MSEYHKENTSSSVNLLHEARFNFDQKNYTGDSVEDVNKLYLQMDTTDGRVNESDRTNGIVNPPVSERLVISAVLYTAMPDDLNNLTSEELKNLFLTESRLFVQGSDNALFFDSLNEIGLRLRQIKSELHKREVDV